MATHISSSHDIEEFRESLKTPTLSDSRKYSNAPVHILDSISHYVEHGIEPGGFVKAVLSNDLVATFQIADAKSLRGLPDILRYIYWEIPLACWGSEAKVEAWMGNKNKT
jgi:hypothetical protein